MATDLMHYDCLICGNSDVEVQTNTATYRKCSKCHHETLISPVDNHFMVNDQLILSHVHKFDFLERFRHKITKIATNNFSCLVDIGSASGKFLFHTGGLFDRSIGVEVSPECVVFSQRELKLHIEIDISTAPGPISTVSFWHSLEHLPHQTIANVFKHLSANTTDDAIVIISVPNCDSWQHKLLGSHYAFFDPQQHLHQFSMESLDQLLINYGFTKNKLFFSPPYSGFGWLQGMMNLFNKTHNYFYYRMKRGVPHSSGIIRQRLLDAYNIILALLLALPASIATACDYLNKKRGGVLTVCYQKRPSA